MKPLRKAQRDAATLRKLLSAAEAEMGIRRRIGTLDAVFCEQVAQLREQWRLAERALSREREKVETAKRVDRVEAMVHRRRRGRRMACTEIHRETAPSIRA